MIKNVICANGYDIEVLIKAGAKSLHFQLNQTYGRIEVLQLHVIFLFIIVYYLLTN